MRILFDTNVLLDALLTRAPFAKSAISLLSAVELGDLQGYLCATTITTIDYLVSKAAGRSTANDAVDQLLQIFEVAPVDRRVLQGALALEFTDFEDAVLYVSALFVGVDAVVTRDKKGFTLARIPILSPEELVALLSQSQ